MKPSLILLVGVAAATALTPIAAAQPGSGPPPGYGPPPPRYYVSPPDPERHGLAIGFGFGIGGMDADSGDLRCDGCNGTPIAGGLEFHIGAMINPRLAILFELSGTAQQLDADGVETLTQIMLMGAVQYWLTPMLWIKGGLGSSHLSLSYDDGYSSDSSELDSGLGVMGAIGYEVLHSPRFAIDLSLRLAAGTYEGLDDTINSGIFGVGFNWY
jgi:hypothetical protein